MVSFTSLLVAILATTTLAHRCLSDDEALTFSKKWLAIWGSNYLTKKSQLRDFVSKDVLNFDGTYGPPNIGIDALFAAATYVDPLVKNVLQTPEWVFHNCDEICVRWSYKALSTGVGSTVPAGTHISFDGIEILLIDLKTRLVTNSTSSADWVQLALQLGQTVNI